MAYGFWLLLHDLVLHHAMQFRNLYLIFLSVSQCQGISPCYAILEWWIHQLKLNELKWISKLVTDIPNSRGSCGPQNKKLGEVITRFYNDQGLHIWYQIQIELEWPSDELSWWNKMFVYKGGTWQVDINESSNVQLENNCQAQSTIFTKRSTINN